MNKLLFLIPLLCLNLGTLYKIQAQDQKLDEQLTTYQKEKAALQAQLETLKGKIENVRLAKIREDLRNNGLPQHHPNEEIVEHEALILQYSEEHEQAKWVAHIISPEIKTGNFSRSNDFRVDPKVSTGTAVETDYFFTHLQSDGTKEYEGFGYDRGHLAPSADFRWSGKALSESYFYSNMSPQKGALNRERWASMEDRLRWYVLKHEEPLYVVTGGVLTEGLETIGENKVSIPKYFYKVALDITGDNQQGIAFIMPNDACPHQLLDYSVSIDSVEALTGIDFFPNLADELENKLEGEVNLTEWQTKEEEGNAKPLDPLKLPKNTFNTLQAKYQVDIGKKVTICGCVVSTYHSKKNSATFLNLDRKFPNQIFTVTIWGDARTNFSYAPEKELDQKTICVKGKVTIDKKGIPSMNIKNEKAISIYK